MKYADKLGAKYSVVIGDDEISGNLAKLKNMENGEAVDTVLCAKALSEKLKEEMF